MPDGLMGQKYNIRTGQRRPPCRQKDHWNVCHHVLFYREETVSVLETPREPHYIGACPEKWLYFGHKCLLLHLPEVPEDGKTWTDAESICSSFGGNLVAIESEIEQAYITMFLQGSAVGLWIGLQNDDSTMTVRQAWTSGKTLSYTNWSPYEPRTPPTIDQYGWLHGFEPELNSASSCYGFVCQKPQDTSKPPTHSYRPPSAHEKIEYRDQNYRVASGNMSWYESMHLCSQRHSELASIRDPYHQAFLTVLVNRLAAPHWIGLYSRDSGINYQWSDGSDMVYSHWDSADEEEDFLTGDCVYMDVNGGWMRADCETKLPGALCHVPELITKAMSTSEAACPSTWVKFKSVCYNFEPVVQRLTLEEAREHCRQKMNTSDVLTIDSDTENMFILEELWSQGFLISLCAESLTWVDGSPVNSTNWPSRPPDRSELSTDTCVSIKAVNGIWSLTECHQKLGFVCKTITYKDPEVEAEPINGLHHGVIAAAVLVAVVVFALLAGAFCLVYRRSHGHFRGIGSAYYRQTNSQSEGNVLITDLETRSGNSVSSVCPLEALCRHDAFTIQLSGTERCISADASGQLTLAPCDTHGTSQLWKWGSGERLFHVATAKCLGLNYPFKKLSLLECNFGPILWWRCRNNLVYTLHQMGLAATTDGKVLVKKELNDTWVLGGTQDSICDKPYHIVYTINGNARVLPASFPSNTKVSGITAASLTTTPTRDSSGASHPPTTNGTEGGNCLIPVVGCQTLFEGSGEMNSCYEFVSSAAVTWRQALDSCRSQGGDLLSVTEPDDLHSKTMLDGLSRMPERMWIGLHQLDPAQGWQWSDGSPLSFLRWETGMPPTFTILDSDCGVLNTNRSYEVESCDIKLPYICKKPLNASKTTPEDSLAYKDTVCSEGWVSWSGWCYKLVKNNPLSFRDALTHCKDSENGASLASFHSIDSKEMISTSFIVINHKQTQEPVTFTYWDSHQPTQPTQDPSCVYYSGESLKWRVGNCSEKLQFMCQKQGKVKEEGEQDECPYKDGWRRHANSCYRLNTKQVSFEDHCNFTIRNSFEQAFINQLLAEQISSKSQHFWIALRDSNSSGEYQWVTPNSSEVTYTNWGATEPSRDGGCVVISTVKPLGGWKAKSCDLIKAGSICRRDVGPVPVPEPEPDSSAPCPNGWVSRPNIKNCYKVFHEERLSQKRSWAEAENFCNALGANLASFAHLAEMRALHSIMRETISDNRFFWVGLNRRNPASRSWQWSNGRPVSLDILHQDFHMDDPYSRDCTAFKTMKSNLKHLFVFLLHDVNPIPFYVTPFHCDAKLEWVCQIPRGKKLKSPEWYTPEGFHDSSIFIDKNEFWFVKEPQLNYEEAKLYCKEQGSTLASPPSFTAARQIHQKLSEVSPSLPTKMVA
ncbi:hypothetical protein WMY93_032017 [Mugilogobius chulae]|uniref:C-type lectin domain-containing protein n=1 Tax=Mugilogobius chulae TaxID=88201 RepID=A0AAW0ML29_9GOBI